MAIEIEQPFVGLSKIAVSDTHGEDSPYFAGWKAYDENPYNESSNPSGVIQMGLAENQVSAHVITMINCFRKPRRRNPEFFSFFLEFSPNVSFLICLTGFI